MNIYIALSLILGFAVFVLLELESLESPEVAFRTAVTWAVLWPLFAGAFLIGGSYGWLLNTDGVDDDRYQYQCRLVKAWRWLRWKPWYAVIGAWWIIKWIASGCWSDPELKQFFPTKWSTLKHLWFMSKSLGSAKMGHWYATDEMLEHIRSRHA